MWDKRIDVNCSQLKGFFWKLWSKKKKKTFVRSWIPHWASWNFSDVIPATIPAICQRESRTESLTKKLEKFISQKTCFLWGDKSSGTRQTVTPGPSHQGTALRYPRKQPIALSTNVIGHMPDKCRQLGMSSCHEWTHFIVIGWRGWGKQRERLIISVRYRETSLFQGIHCTRQKERSKLKSQYGWW